ncbi:hypothetical protein ADK70_36955 [Streptomyces rimosus subsp. pseudoverticillatus]|nr:hypothetical protein ADK70_36955 [Streptomyces rimosus subsp. pseudoverticillatus]
MPRLGWTVEQQAAARRYFLFTTVLAVVGVALGAFLGFSGNTGGWLLCGFIFLIWATFAAFVKWSKAGRP